MRRLLAQVAHDYLQELGWALLHGITLVIVIYGLARISLSWSAEVAQSASMSRFEEAGVCAVTTGPIPLEQEGASSLGGSAAQLDGYLKDVLSADGGGGTFVQLPGVSLGHPELFDQTVVFLGAYVDLTAFERNPSDALTLAASNDVLQETHERTIELERSTYELAELPRGMDLFHPLWYISPEEFENTFQRTLFVFCPDYSRAHSVIPELSGADLLNRLVLLDPSEADRTRLRRAVLEGRGELASIQSVADLLADQDQVGLRTPASQVVFFCLATAVLLGALLVSLYRILARKVRTYGICHLFGASLRECGARAFLLVVLYQAPPMIVSMWLLMQADVLTPMLVWAFVAFAALGSVVLSGEAVRKVVGTCQGGGGRSHDS